MKGFIEILTQSYIHSNPADNKWENDKDTFFVNVDRIDSFGDKWIKLSYSKDALMVSHSKQEINQLIKEATTI